MAAISLLAVALLGTLLEHVRCVWSFPHGVLRARLQCTLVVVALFGFVPALLPCTLALFMCGIVLALRPSLGSSLQCWDSDCTYAMHVAPHVSDWDVVCSAATHVALVCPVVQCTFLGQRAHVCHALYSSLPSWDFGRIVCHAPCIPSHFGRLLALPPCTLPHCCPSGIMFAPWQHTLHNSVILGCCVHVCHGRCPSLSR